jgi:hypothetical protein
MFRGTSHGLQLRGSVSYGLAHARVSQSSADPFARSQVLASGEPLDFQEFLVGKEDLKTLTHAMSV